MIFLLWFASTVKVDSLIGVLDAQNSACLHTQSMTSRRDMGGDDPVGDALRAESGGHRAMLVIERDDGFIEVVEAERYFSRWEAWPAHVREGLTHVRGRVLDLGCGSGRHARYLQDRGFEVTGIDISPGAIVVARHLGLANSMHRSIADVRRFASGRFHTFLMLWNNFGLFGSAPRAQRLLSHMARISAPDARIIAESRDVTSMRGIHRDYQLRNLERGRLPGQFRWRLRFGQARTPWRDYLMVSSREMNKILEGTGWHIQRLLPADDGAQYVAVIVKRSTVRDLPPD
ncbi:MAG: class I SAM-dependent methyltransferase [Acidobacteriota bacterium]